MKLARSRAQLHALGRALAGGKLSAAGRATVRKARARQAAVVRYREKLAKVSTGPSA
jgi:hypothetical protein